MHVYVSVNVETLWKYTEINGDSYHITQRSAKNGFLKDTNVFQFFLAGIVLATLIKSDFPMFYWISIINKPRKFLALNRPL